MNTNKNELTVALVMPTLSLKALNEISCNQTKVIGTIDNNKNRETFKNEEEQLIDAFVNHYISVLDKKFTQFLSDERKRIETITDSLVNFMQVDTPFPKEEWIISVKPKLQINNINLNMNIYFYEASVELLSMYKYYQKVKSLEIKDFKNQKVDSLMLQLTEKIQIKLENSIKEYLQNQPKNINITFKHKLSHEFLGELARYRSRYHWKNPSEGDYYKYGSDRSKEAYKEDAPNQYTFKRKNENNNLNAIRQRTIRFSLSLSNEPFLADDVAKFATCFEKNNYIF